MVKSLRNKFVIVTTSLMVAVFGCFLITITIVNNYWNSIEIVDMLEWIADSGIFSMETNKLNERWMEELAEDDNPIIGIILDEEHNIIRKQVLGNGNYIQIPAEILSRMCEYNDKTNRIEKYYYYYSELDNNQILLVIMDTSVNGNLLLRIIGIVGISILGIILLILITLYLSRFVTKPAEQSLLREKRFISDASHELKTPLGAISINAQAMKLIEEDNLYLNNIISESDRMNRLIEKLLTLSRLDEEPDVICENINISEICEEMALTYESVAFEKKIDFDYEIKENLWIKGNVDEFRQLIAILLDNAIKNTPEFGKICIKSDEKNRHKIIIISNTGKGISEADQPHVFERFYTSDKARENNSFGLGLAIAKSIVERYKGKIEVESIPEKQTHFKIIF